MALKIRELPPEARPVYQIKTGGPRDATVTDLLACLLSTEDALNQAQELLAKFRGLRGMRSASLADLMAIKGIGPAVATRLQAALELGRRCLSEEGERRTQIKCPADLYGLLVDLGDLAQEEFWVVSLNTKRYVIDFRMLYRGTLNSTFIQPSEVLLTAVRAHGDAFAIVHNHPSGDPTPSPEDVILTDRLRQSGDILGIELVDHIIIGDACFVSLKERGLGGLQP
ncbi:MAG: RadC family protein [Planctomycetota bacterium]|jgi:DNA repair protein RadC